LIRDCIAYVAHSYETHYVFINTQVGEAAVPINMIILGINLSSTFQKKKKSKNDNNDNEKNKVLSSQTVMAVVVGKMVIMPIIGIISTWALQRYYVAFPDGELDFHERFIFYPKQLHGGALRVR